MRKQNEKISECYVNFWKTNLPKIGLKMVNESALVNTDRMCQVDFRRTNNTQIVKFVFFSLPSPFLLPLLNFSVEFQAKPRFISAVKMQTYMLLFPVSVKILQIQPHPNCVWHFPHICKRQALICDGGDPMYKTWTMYQCACNNMQYIERNFANILKLLIKAWSQTKSSCGFNMKFISSVSFGSRRHEKSDTGIRFRWFLSD